PGGRAGRIAALPVVLAGQDRAGAHLGVLALALGALADGPQRLELLAQQPDPHLDLVVAPPGFRGQRVGREVPAVLPHDLAGLAVQPHDLGSDLRDALVDHLGVPPGYCHLAQLVRRVLLALVGAGVVLPPGRHVSPPFSPSSTATLGVRQRPRAASTRATEPRRASISRASARGRTRRWQARTWRSISSAVA